MSEELELQLKVFSVKKKMSTCLSKLVWRIPYMKGEKRLTLLQLCISLCGKFCISLWMKNTRSACTVCLCYVTVCYVCGNKCDHASRKPLDQQRTVACSITDISIWLSPVNKADADYFNLKTRASVYFTPVLSNFTNALSMSPLATNKIFAII